MTEVSVEEILELQRQEHGKIEEQEKLKAKILRDRGLQPETLFDDIYS